MISLNLSYQLPFILSIKRTSHYPSNAFSMTCSIFHSENIIEFPYFSIAKVNTIMLQYSINFELPTSFHSLKKKKNRLFSQLVKCIQEHVPLSIHENIIDLACFCVETDNTIGLRDTVDFEWVSNLLPFIGLYEIKLT